MWSEFKLSIKKSIPVVCNQQFNELFYIFKLIMANLQHDINQQRQKVLSLVGQYQKISQEIIKSNHTSQLHTLLDGIASFDHQRIRQCQNIINDQTVLQFLDNIAVKIKNLEETKIKQTTKHAEVVERSKQIQVKQKAIPKQNSSKKQGGLFDFVKNKFGSKQKKATQMILPEEQPKCYYDPVTKTYIFQGQQPQAPKEIPRPPSAPDKKSKEAIVKQKNDSQLSQLTAPPAFKRKSTAASKSKIKIKQEIEVVKAVDQPLTFARLIQEINRSYNLLLENAKVGVYQRHANIHADNFSALNDFVTFAQKNIECSEEVSNYESKMIEKWSKILTSQSRQLKIMDKVINEISESAMIYNDLITKLKQPPISAAQSMIINTKIKANQQTQTQKITQTQLKQPIIVKEYIRNKQDEEAIMSMENQLNLLGEQNRAITSQISVLQSERDSYMLKKLQIQNQYLVLTKKYEVQEHQISLLKESNTRLQQSLAQLKREHQNISIMHMEQLKLQSDEFIFQKKELSAKVIKLEEQKKTINQQKSDLQCSLKNENSRINQMSEYWKTEILKQRLIIQQQLKFKQEKERSYLQTLKSMQEHENILNQYDSSLFEQKNLLMTILKTRLQLSKSPQAELEPSTDKVQLEQSANSFVSQLSEIVGLITEATLDRFQIFSRSYCKLHHKYLQSKSLLGKLKNSSTGQSTILNRSVTKFKALLETYKTQKQEAQQRCLQIQLECDKLKKKLNQYKEEDQFNKSYLAKLKPSKVSSQDESFLSLQEDKQQLTTQIDDLHKQIEVKNQALIKNQKDLEDLLINYQKNQQKLLTIQDKLKQSEKQIKRFKEICEKQENKIKLLQLKLKNQKERYDQVQNREQSKFKSLESSFDKKLKLLKSELDQSFQREKNLKQQMEYIDSQFKKRVDLIQKNHQSVQNELKKAIKLKTNQNNELLIKIQDLNQRLHIEREQKSGLNQRNIHLMQIETQLNKKLNDIIDEHLKQIDIHRQSQQNLNNVIAALLEKYSSFKQEQSQFKAQYEYRLYRLQEELQNSQLQSNQLLNQINQYSNHITSLNSVIQSINSQHSKERQIYQHEVRQASALIQSFRAQRSDLIAEKQHLELTINSLKKQNQQKLFEFKQLEQVIQKMSEQMIRLTSDHELLQRDKTDLQQQLRLKDRQIETLSNQLNKRSEQLLIKTQDLMQKDEMLLANEQFSVTKKQQLDQLKNQLEKFRSFSEQMEKLGLTRERLSRDKTDLQQKLIFKDRQIETLYNELNKKSEQLLIKTEELSQKEQALLQNLQLSVTKKQEFEELKNQIEHFKRDNQQHEITLRQKNRMIQQNHEEISNLSLLVQELNKQIQSITQNNQSYIKDEQKMITSLQQELENQQQLIQKQHRQIDSLGQKLSTSQKWALNLNQELESVKIQHSSFKNKLIILTRQIQSYQSQNGQLLRRIQQAQSQQIQTKEKNTAKQESKQSAKNEEIEGQMGYLLKQIQLRENQVEKLKQQLRDQQKAVLQAHKQKEELQIILESMNQKVEETQKQVQLLRQTLLKVEENLKIQSEQKISLLSSVKRLTQCNKFLQLDLLSLQGKKHELYVDAQKQLISIKDLSKMLQKKRSIQVKEEQDLQQGQQIDEKSMIQDLIADIRIKDQNIILKQQEIESEEKRIIELQKENCIKQDQIRKVLKKSQEDMKRISQLEAKLRDRDMLDPQISQLQESPEVSSKKVEIQSLRSQLQSKNCQIQRLREILADKAQQFKLKQAQYLSKIAQLQSKEAKVEAIPPNTVSQQAYKALLDENTALINQKVELMKSNNYLVSINQKLVGEKSSYNMRQVHKAQSHVAPVSSIKPTESKQRPSSQTNPKEQNKDRGGGFFGTLSSLFLTPTQTDRLRK